MSGLDWNELLFGSGAAYVWGSVAATLLTMGVEWGAVALRERDVARRWRGPRPQRP
jgi:heme exporter protein D